MNKKNIVNFELLRFNKVFNNTDITLIIEKIDLTFINKMDAISVETYFFAKIL